MTEIVENDPSALSAMAPAGLITAPESEQQASGWQEIILPATFTISEIEAWYPDLKNQFGKRVQLNGAAINRVDTAALQILLAFMRSPEITAGWVQPSVTLCEAAYWLGLTAELGLPPYSYEVAR